MKAARRQELRTNELSHQIDRLGESVKQNSAKIGGATVVAIIAVSAIYWYSSHQSGIRNDALAKLTYIADKDNPMGFIDRCKSVANEGINDSVTRAAWLQIANRAMLELTTPTTKDDPTAKPLDKAELAKIAREAYVQVLKFSSDDATARGAALYGIGVLDENAGNYESARKHYEEIKGDKALAETPFIAQAEFRLSEIESWAEPVEFPPPPPLVVGPDAPPGDSSTFTPTPGTSMTPPPGVPGKKTITIGQPPAGFELDENNNIRPIATPQPGAEATPADSGAESPASGDASPAPTTQPAQN